MYRAIGQISTYLLSGQSLRNGLHNFITLDELEISVVGWVRLSSKGRLSRMEEFAEIKDGEGVTNEGGALVMTHQPPIYIVQMLPTSSLPNQTTICNHSASTTVRQKGNTALTRKDSRLFLRSKNRRKSSTRRCYDTRSTKLSTSLMV